MSEAADQPLAGHHLRASYIWRDEVMADVVMTTQGQITLGTGKHDTFTLPALDLPDGFAILRPGARGYVLTLGTKMRGRLSLGKSEMEVSQFLQRGAAQGSDTSQAAHADRAEGAAGSFRATPVGPGDWGVIELDDTGEHTLFFQFVPVEPALPPSRWRDTELLLPALAFAIILHAVLLAVSFKLKEDGYSLAFPGRRELMTTYLVRRPEPEPEPTPAIDGSAEAAASKDGEKASARSATRGESGTSGGEGEERSRDPDPGEVPPQVDTGLLTKESRSAIRRVTKNTALDDRLKRSLSRLKGDALAGTPGAGTGSGSGFGPGESGTGTTRGGKGTGPGGGGSAQGDFVSQGKVDTGETRAPKGSGGGGRGSKEVAVVGTGNASGDFGGLSKAEIERVIKSRQGLIRACYQRELDRTRGLGGTLMLSFRIQPSGAVQSVRVVPGKSSLRNPKVESCVTRQISRLKFPAKGGGVVNYPFIFSQG